jgi:hypothetical protein
MSRISLEFDFPVAPERLVPVMAVEGPGQDGDRRQRRQDGPGRRREQRQQDGGQRQAGAQKQAGGNSELHQHARSLRFA